MKPLLVKLLVILLGSHRDAVAVEADFQVPPDGSDSELRYSPNLEDVEIVVRPHHAWIVNLLRRHLSRGQAHVVNAGKIFSFRVGDVKGLS